MLETNLNSPDALLAQVALGNREAFGALYRATSNRLFGICLRVLAERSEAEDVLQEVFTTVWRKASQFDASRATGSKMMLSARSSLASWAAWSRSSCGLRCGSGGRRPGGPGGVSGGDGVQGCWPRARQSFCLSSSLRRGSGLSCLDPGSKLLANTISRI